MSNFMVVAIVNGFNDLDEYFPGIILREIAKVLQVVEQLSSLAVVHHDVKVLDFRVYVVYPYYVWMVLTTAISTSLLRIMNYYKLSTDLLSLAILLAARTAWLCR